MSTEDPDTDDEIGLTEEEIQEITGNNSLEIEDRDLRDHPSNQGDAEDEEENQENISHFIEEIDLSNLEKEVATIDLSQEDTEEENFKNDVEIDDSHFNLDDPLDLKETIPPPPKSPPIKIRSKPMKPSIAQTPKKTVKKSTKSIQPAASKSTSTAKKSSTRPKTIHKANQERAHVKKPASAQTGNGYDTQQMKALFVLLDEMLSHLPQEKIKKFAFTPEYEYYLTLLKKLGI